MVKPAERPRRQWGPLERGVRHLGLDPADPATRVLTAIAAFADERTHGLPELSPLQISHRCAVDRDLVPAAIDSLVRDGLLDAGLAKRPDARRLRVRVQPIDPLPKENNEP